MVSIPRYYILVSYRSQNYGLEPSLNYLYTYTLFIKHTYLFYASIAHNIPAHTKLSIVIYLYIQMSICILLFLIYLFFLLFFLLSVFFLSLPFCCTAVASVTKTNSLNCRKCAFTNVVIVDPNMEIIFEFYNLRFFPEMFCHISVITKS